MNNWRELWKLLPFAEWGEQLKRRWCRIWGHNWHHDDRGAPVINLFAVCRRCGKWTRLIEPSK